MADNGFDIAGYIQQALEQKNLIDTTTQELRHLQIQNTDLTDQMVTSIMGGTDANGETPLSLQTKKLAELETQKKKDEFYTYIGMNDSGAAKLTNNLADTFVKSTKEAQATAADLKQRKSVGLLDNPLGYFWNQLIIPDQEIKLQGQLDEAKIASDALQKVNAAAQQTAATEKMFEKSMTEASIDSQVAGLQANLATKAISARMAANQSNAHDLVTIMNANAQQLQTIGAVIQMRNSEEHLQMQRESAAREQARFNEWQQDVKAKKEYEQEWLGYINKGAEIAGMAPLDSRKAISMLRSGQQLPSQVQKLAELGFVNSKAGMENKLGATPWSVRDAVVTLNLPVTPQVADIYRTAEERVAAEAATNPALAKDKAARELRFNQLVKDINEGRNKVVNPLDQSNPYLIPSLKFMAETSPEFQNSKLYKVLAPQIANGFNTQDSNRIIEAGIEAVKTGKMTISELSTDLVNYHSQAIKANNAQAQFYKFGLNEQEHYVIRPQTSGGILKGFFKDKPTDMTSKQQVDEYLIRRFIPQFKSHLQQVQRNVNEYWENK